jgi:hypothetical protein
MVDSYAIAQPVACRFVVRVVVRAIGTGRAGGNSQTMQECRHSSGKQDLLDIEDGVIGKRLGDFANHLVRHLLMQLLA